MKNFWLERKEKNKPMIVIHWFAGAFNRGKVPNIVDVFTRDTIDEKKAKEGDGR